MKRLGVFLLPPGWMLVHRRVTPGSKFAVTHLYTWMERGTVRVKCLAQEHNTTSLARARTQTARSRVERTNPEATLPPLRPRLHGSAQSFAQLNLFLDRLFTWIRANPVAAVFTRVRAKFRPVAAFYSRP